MKYVIIDDQPYAIASLKADIEEVFKKFKFEGSANGVVSGVKLIKKVSPDIIFLDIEMGDGDGFDVMDILEDYRDRIVFITGSKEYAIKAFRYNAKDYLLKPVDHDDLKEAVNKIIKEKTPISLNVKKLTLSTNEEIKVVNVTEIVRLESLGNYTNFYFDNGEKLLVTKTMKEYAKTLESCGFARVHQSHLVNIEFIDSYQKTEGGYLLMKNKDIVPVSVRKKSEVIDLLNKL